MIATKPLTALLPWARGRRLAMLALALVPMALVWNNQLGDIRLYFAYAEQMAQGRLPYRDFAFEYPPLVLPILALPRLLWSERASYAVGFMALMCSVDALQKWALWRSLPRGRRGWALVLQTAASTGLYFTYLRRFDVVVATVSVAMLLHLVRRPCGVGAWIWWGIGVALKLYPLALAPVMLTYSHGRGARPRKLGRQVAAGLGAVILAFLPALWAAGDNALSFVTFHTQRGVQANATYVAWAILRAGIGQPLPFEFNHGAHHIVGPWSEQVAAWSWAAMLAAVAVTWRLTLPRLWRTPSASGLWTTAAATVLALLLTAKVFSPQFMIWLVPLVLMAALCPARIDWPLVLVLLVGIGLTSEVFPGESSLLNGLKPHKQVALVARAGVLLGLWGLLVAPSAAFMRRRPGRAAAQRAAARQAA